MATIFGVLTIAVSRARFALATAVLFASHQEPPYGWPQKLFSTRGNVAHCPGGGKSATVALSVSDNSRLCHRNSPFIRTIGFEVVRGRILRLGTQRVPTALVKRLQRLIKLSDAGELPDLDAKRSALADLGITLLRRISNGEVSSVARVGDIERPLWRRPVLPSYVASGQPQAQQPDGSGGRTTTTTRLNDPQTLEEAEEWTDVHMALADAAEYEYAALEADLRQYMENPDEVCPASIVPESPDGASASADSNRADCLDNLVTAIMGATSAVREAVHLKDGLQSGIATLRVLVSGHWAAYAAGGISYAVATDMIAGAVMSFVGSLSLGWIAVGVLGAGALYFAYKFIECHYDLLESEEPFGALSLVGEPLIADRF